MYLFNRLIYKYTNTSPRNVPINAPNRMHEEIFASEKSKNIQVIINLNILICQINNECMNGPDEKISEVVCRERDKLESYLNDILKLKIFIVMHKSDIKNYLEKLRETINNFINLADKLRSGKFYIDKIDKQNIITSLRYCLFFLSEALKFIVSGENDQNNFHRSVECLFWFNQTLGKQIVIEEKLKN